jgi:hypothetical protein
MAQIGKEREKPKQRGGNKRQPTDHGQRSIKISDNGNLSKVLLAVRIILVEVYRTKELNRTILRDENKSGYGRSRLNTTVS